MIEDKETVEIKKEEIISSTTTLTLNNVIITSRSEDNYINATQLCQAGCKIFSDWYSLDTTKELILLLESKTVIPALNLVEVNYTGSWIHPDLAIQLAQWISPGFALQVSLWIHTLFITGTVSVDSKLLKEKEDQIKAKDQEIMLLKNTYVKKQKRENNHKNVIYLLTTEENKKNRIYILGKASKLSDRLSGYNKTCEHQVVHYKQCVKKNLLGVAENLILDKLSSFKEVANRDRFILPVDKDISYFTNLIDKCVDLVNSSSDINL
jgi:hypothetical protein